MGQISRGAQLKISFLELIETSAQQRLGAVESRDSRLAARSEREEQIRQFAQGFGRSSVIATARGEPRPAQGKPRPLEPCAGRP